MDNTPDKTIVTLMRGIKTHESGGNYNQAPETAGTSLGGAYMYQKPTWQQYAKETMGDSNLPFTPENQDKVTYHKIKQWKEQGLNPEQIISKWNPGAGTKYVDMVKKAVIGKSTQTNTPPTPTTPQTFEDYLKNVKTQPNADLKAGNPTTPGNTGIGNAIANFTPGSKLAQAAGYGLSGNQEGLIKANDQGIDIQGQLLKQIKANKAKGKDTSRLEKAVKELGLSLEENAGKVSDVGTGGISNKEVLESAGSLATLPAMAYGATVLGGGGLMGTARGLQPGVLGTSLPRAFSNPVIKGIMETRFGAGKAIGSLPQKEVVNTLSQTLKELTVGQIKGKEGQAILKALQELTPQLKQSLLAKLAKGTLSEATRFLIYNALGDKLGGLVNKVIP